ncbi:hypothetical protein [Aeromicrobium sp.]|uniref:hypothetical protein n=1 Tax=Aeromicrobium sp. TaxID=1871063 RepID=UPI001984DDF6|nr:hypothetical protein [Aeromicrobium sp.]MBC7630877.1 hypothetical protein [Aeromicrobium sp.]
MRSVTGDALDSEPFYRELHRRHPDVDIVILAGQEPTAADTVPLDDARLVAHESRTTFDDIWSLLTSGGISADAVARWRAGTVEGVVNTEIVGRLAGVERAEGERLLRSLAESLTARAWAVQVHSDGAPRVIAGHDNTSVRLVWWDRTATLTVQGPGTAVGTEGVRALLSEHQA